MLAILAIFSLLFPYFSRLIDDEGNSDLEETTINSTKREEEDTMIGKVHVMQQENPENMDSKFKDTSVILIPELERRMEYSPMFVPVNQDLNNDIYFIGKPIGFL